MLGPLTITALLLPVSYVVITLTNTYYTVDVLQ